MSAEYLYIGTFQFHLNEQGHVGVFNGGKTVWFTPDVKSWRELTVWANGFVAGKGKGWGDLI
jgi:hypothetical protein